MERQTSDEWGEDSRQVHILGISPASVVGVCVGLAGLWGLGQGLPAQGLLHGGEEIHKVHNWLVYVNTP